MYKKRLFERIANFESYEHTSTKEMQLASIIKYLKSILSMRKGTTKMNEKLGMDDIFTSYNESFESFIHKSQRELEEEIRLLEPRLKNISVFYEGKDSNDLFYKFRIECEVVEFENSKIIFNTIINSEGRVEVNE